MFMMSADMPGLASRVKLYRSAPASDRGGGSTLAARLAIVLITIAGLASRVAGARGDLWLDEIWSLDLLSEIKSAADIVVALPYDNNHVLNSLWLVFVGPGAPPLLARLPAVIFGALCAPVAARIGWRHGPAPALAEAAVFAFAYPFVHFGSEARGYSGLILAILVAYDALERVLANQNRRRNLIVFALAVGFGTFSHLTMVEATFVLCAAAAGRLADARRPAVSTHALAWSVGLAALSGTMPAVACFLASLFPGPYDTGLVTPFSADAFVEGLGRLARALVGLPDGPAATRPLAMLLALTGAATLLMLGRVPRERRFFPALAILGLPVLHAALRLPNAQYSRFYLTTALALALLAADTWARAWRGGPMVRAAALTTAIGFFAGQAANLTAFLAAGRGHYGEATAFMSANGPATFLVLPPNLAGETGAVIRWYAIAQGTAGAIRPAVPSKGCTAPPDWLLVVRSPDDPPNQNRLDIAGPCPMRFVMAHAFPAYGFSGFVWTLYRRGG